MRIDCFFPISLVNTYRTKYFSLFNKSRFIQDLNSCYMFVYHPFIFSCSDMLKMGKSKPWPEALEKLTGSKELDVGALTEYFQPLRDWLEKQRSEIGYPGPGWEEKPTSGEPTAGVSALNPVLFNMFALLFSLITLFW